MNENELAEALSEMCHNAPRREKVTAIYLFGIKYAADLTQPRISIPSVVDLADIGHSYASEVYTGIRLAQYVDFRRDAVAHGLWFSV